MNKGRFSGKVLWWCNQNGNGVIEDSRGNEYYFDTSVTNIPNFILNKRYTEDILVEFQLNDEITDCVCAKYVELKGGSRV